MYEYCETKTSELTNNELPNKRIEIEQLVNWDYFSIRTGYYRVKIDCGLFEC